VAKANIMVVEDAQIVSLDIQRRLKSLGYEVPATAVSGEEAIEKAGKAHPDLVLMDILLPGIDGIAALGQLRADAATRAIPVIAVTASVMTHDRKKIMAAGFDGYQSKPIKVKELMDAVREMLDRRAGA